MFLPLYIFSLGLSAGVMGVFFRRLLATFGLAPDFHTGLVLAVGIACAYMSLQLLYIAFLKTVQPFRGNAPLFAESLSLGAVVCLLPWLANIQVPWPHPLLLEFEAIIYLGLFGLVHLFFKLVALFWTTQTQISSRIPVVLWLAASIVCAGVTLESYRQWSTVLKQAQIMPCGEAQAYEVGSSSALARALPERIIYEFDIRGQSGREMIFRWASEEEEKAEDREIYVTLHIDGTAAHRFTQVVELEKTGWVEMRVPKVNIPADATTCSISWSYTKDPVWLTQSGIRPVNAGDQAMLISGPSFHEARQFSDDPNIILLAVEGLGAEHMHGLGYERNTSAQLDTLVARAVTYENAYTPAPDAAAACMTLLTGVNPLVHGYLGDYSGLLPESIQTLPEVLQAKHYSTAAFTEGLGPDTKDLFYGSGFERGFEVFDAAYPSVARKSKSDTPRPPAPKGSKYTLRKAADWIAAHRDLKFMTFIRLRELREPLRLSRYGNGFLGQGRTPTPMDIYDTALADVDKQLGAFIDQVEERLNGLHNTCIILTSLYGFDFSEPGRGSWRRGGPATRRLAESALRVPILVLAPGEPARRRSAVVSLEDVTATILELAEARFTHTIHGRNLLEYVPSQEPIAMMGEPLQLSLRTNLWRYTWQSGQEPYTGKQVSSPAPQTLFSFQAYRQNKGQTNNLGRHRGLVEQYTKVLEEYLSKQVFGVPAVASGD